jgi:Carboxypeptidase regulatory-like domain
MKLSYTGAWRFSILAWVFLNHAAAQSRATGSIAGTVRDPASAVVPNAAVTLSSLDTEETQSNKTNGDGVYSFTQLKPGHYQVSVTMVGFAKMVKTTSVEVGQTSLVDLTLQITKGTETIEVTTGAPLISSEPGVVTNFTPMEIALLPAPGGDMTTIAFTAPGVVVAPGSGYGNFTVNGLPGTSNLFTVNGENAMDPYFNINTSGASNMMLGINEVQEAAVVTNPYSGQYGQLVGAQVSYVTKSGTNGFHGNADWWWNGRAMNSNDFFSNASSAPRPFSNANQWAASIGGPVIKDHTWFFVDTEGLRFILPNVNVETMPTPAFATAIVNNITALEPNELPAYQDMFKIYATASAGKVLSPVSVQNGDECDTVALPGWKAGSTCANTFVTTPTSFTKEWILAGRIDQKLTSNDDLFFRFKLDHGLQPTIVDPLTPAFDATSSPPSWDYQVNLRHVFNSNVTNVFTATVSHYDAQFFQNESAWRAVFPYGGVFTTFDDGFSSINTQVNAFPQGRNITQYQFIDDFSWTRGRHSLKFGVNFRRYDVSDHNFFNINPTTTFYDLTSTKLGRNGMTGMQAYANGLAQVYTQQYSPSTDVPIALWGVGFYMEDQWKVTPHLTLMGALRFEKNANPVCNTNCLSDFKTSFPNLASVTSISPGDVPYSSDINTALHQAYPGVDPINLSPRLSFNWAPGANNHFPFFSGGNKTAISGGVGIFYDNPEAGLVDYLLGNPPRSVLFNVAPLDANSQTIGILPFDSSAANGGPASFATASSNFDINKSYNQLSTILNPIIGSTPPISISSIQGTIHSPQAQEWNLKVDQEITQSTAVSVSYNGNHSIHILYFDNWWNALALNSVFANVPGINPNPVPNYGTVTTIQSGAVSNYNGVTATVRVMHHSWLMAHVNYTYSHTLDESSNGGIVPIGGWAGGGPAGFGGNIQTQINPVNLRANNYGNADYDVRNLVTSDFVVVPPTHLENRLLKGLLGGWQWSGKVYAHSGLPYSVYDGNTGGDLLNGGIALGDLITPGASNSCGSGAAYTNTNIKPCLNSAAFASNVTAYTTYPNQTRNQFRGPNYIDFDMGVYKTFPVRDRFTFGLGATAFNVFNHPNFNLPDNELGSPQFGQIESMQGVPVSPFGNFLGFDSSIRVVQLTARFIF